MLERMSVQRPCPDTAHGAPSKIGTRRFDCRTCNTFARRIERAVQKALKEAHPDDYAKLRETTEATLYTDLITKGTSNE